MADTEHIFPGVKLSGDLISHQQRQNVVLWDLGPPKPAPPKRPDAPQGRRGDPAYDLAMIEFKETLDEYEAALKQHKADKAEYAKWQKDMGGPIERAWYSVDANDALARDPKRYCISASTRGYEKLPNRGLPEGMKPGHGQAEQRRRAQEMDADMAAALQADPVFGQQELRA